MLEHAPVKLAGDAADRLLVADVGGPQPAAGQAAQMSARLDEQNALSHPRRLNRRRDAAGRAAVDDDVVRFVSAGRQREQQQSKRRPRGFAASAMNLGDKVIGSEQQDAANRGRAAGTAPRHGRARNPITMRGGAASFGTDRPVSADRKKERAARRVSDRAGRA